MSIKKSIPIVLFVFGLACDSEEKALPAAKYSSPSDQFAGSYRSTPGYVIDSVFAMEEELRRFRATIEGSPTSLSGVYTSKEELVRKFLTAAGTQDSAALRSLHITVEEFAHLYFPFSEFAHPPYEMKPGFWWYQATVGSNHGITKVMHAFASYKPIFHKVECAEKPKIQGMNRIWEGCTVHWLGVRWEPRSARLFGGIIERHGRMKFLSFANPL